MSASDPSSGFAPFPSTAWSCIHVVRDKQHPEHEPAVNRFVSLYWKPVFFYLRARGVSFAEAQDLCQEFFVWFLENEKVQRVDPERGRFRDFLRVVVRNFVVDKEGRAKIQKRFEKRFVSIQSLMDDEARGYEPPAGEKPEDVFERQWVANVWRTVLDQLRQRCVDEERESWYQIFLAYDAAEERRPSQEALAKQFGLSRDDSRRILKKMERRFENLLRAELREEGIAEAEIDDELQSLRKYLH